MYAYLQGKFTFKNPAQVYVDVNGVGYEVNISLNTFSYIQHLSEGDIALLKGDEWEGNEGFGVIHRSPSLNDNETRLLLTLDFV